MSIDNDGQGGILALMSLLGVKLRPRPGNRDSRRVGAALIYGDGAITPAISVLSALEGLNIAVKGRSGEVLWDDTIRLGIELRQEAPRGAQQTESAQRAENPARRWFFDPFVPDVVRLPDAANGGGVHAGWRGKSVADQLRWPSHAHFWELAPGAQPGTVLQAS